jgi:hypothetical protein
MAQFLLFRAHAPTACGSASCRVSFLPSTTIMRKLLLTFLTTPLLAGLLHAQATCSTLTVQQGQNHAPITFRVQGDPNALVGLVLGFDKGSTTIPLGTVGTLQLGIASPYDIQYIGMTNGGGILTYVRPVPANLPSTDLVAQAFTVSVTDQLPLTFCTSNVVSFHVGS